MRSLALFAPTFSKHLMTSGAFLYLSSSRISHVSKVEIKMLAYLWQGLYHVQNLSHVRLFGPLLARFRGSYQSPGTCR